MDQGRIKPSGRELSTMKLRASAVQAAARALSPDDEPPSASAPITERPPPETPHLDTLPLIAHADRATLLLLGGAGAGATHALEAETTILGRGSGATLVIDEPSVSRRHARIERDESGAYWLMDLGSTNGTFVNGHRVVARALLDSGDRLQFGRECVFRFALLDETEEALQRRLYEASFRDALTTLANRRCLLEQLCAEMTHARRARGRLSVLAIDVDHFKSVNDTFGHLAGDQVLRAIALAGSRVLRGGDLFARHGGEELAVIARDAGRSEATTLAERIRAAIDALRVEVGSGAIRVTVSIGAAVLDEQGRVDEVDDLLGRADARLYVAKRAGRNRVCTTTPDERTLESQVTSQ